MTESKDLHQELAARLGYSESRLVRLMLKRLAPGDQARIILELPAPPEEIAKKLHLDKETVDKHLQELYEKGAIVPTRKGYQFHRNIMALRDSMSSFKYDEQLGEEFWAVWYGIHQNEWLDWMDRSAVERARQFGSGLNSRIIPKWKAIENNPDKVPYEYLPDLLQAKQVISVCPCPCQRAMWYQGPSPIEACIDFDRTAEYIINRRVGRKLSVDEAVAITDTLNGGEGWIPKLQNSTNQRNLGTLLCSCNVDVCGPMYWCKVRGIPLYNRYQRTRYVAEVDPGACRTCQLCVERCPTGAAQLKQYSSGAKWKSYVDAEKCLGCGICVVNCPNQARRLNLVRPPEWIPEEVPQALLRPYATAIT